MLAQLEKPTNDFFALATYLVHGRQRPTPTNRIAWTQAHNLPDTDPQLAARIMTATAECSKRCRNACYHTIIAWGRDERPAPEVMQEIATKTLTLAGLGEHQALIMGHGDKEHQHLHMMINRVHPDTGRAWSTSHDYRRFDRIMRELSEDYGFKFVPAHAFNPDLTEDLPKHPNSNATYAAKRGARTHRPQWRRRDADRLGQTLSEGLDRNATWEQVEFALAEHGLSLEPKGKGLVAGNAQSYVKFSALKLAIAAKDGRTTPLQSFLASKRPRSPTRRPWWQVDAVDIARVIGDSGDLRAAIQDSAGQRKRRRRRLSLIDQWMAELLEELRSSTALSRPRATKPNNNSRRRNRKPCARRSEANKSCSNVQR